MADYVGTNFYIKPTYIVAIPEFINGNSSRSNFQRENEANLTDNKHKGILSNKSSRKLANAVNWLVSSAKSKRIYSKKHNKYFKFSVNFVTLTFPVQGNTPITERQAKRCVHSFLSYSRKYLGLKNYVWKFELTEKKQLHVHLTTDTFLYYKRIRKSWNKILERENHLKVYNAIHGHNDPNSVDVHAVYKVKDIAAYISKYMAKTATVMSEYKGRIWACNRELSHVNKCTATIYRGDKDPAERVLNSYDVEYKPIMSPPDKMGISKEIAQIFFTNEKVWQKLQNSIIARTYNNHRFLIRNNINPVNEIFWEQYVTEIFDINLKNNASTKIQETSKKAVVPLSPSDRRKRLANVRENKQKDKAKQLQLL